MNDEACSVRRDIIIEFLVKPRQDSNSGRGEFWAAAAAASEKNPRRAKLGLHELFSCKKRGQQTMHCSSQVSRKLPAFTSLIIAVINDSYFPWVMKFWAFGPNSLTLNHPNTKKCLKTLSEFARFEFFRPFSAYFLELLEIWSK